ncbi:Cbf2p KNAG_0B00720 [Huiozyma naganishii CBS 8797]|uniref:Transcription activator GCR1-like domain-containing protein n=1 Tax=Huiozyma naganishii (strain ATCC MYA-139 / BCRC 22969 / CBS 8797 / KCTC 17520 / NBRC 10181 / NCYC 3082 / Yp74L-3) TaxID=1071383 RepID=J7R158_HUIN7|nr:hypothetical protein KNAG_0B00720 [Kazachstania naganishii CBS 8797]CCK68520.1 hypothetical protein KNAG_0B00720 [Kazachstania naganishii CBS 8797]
MDVEEQQQKLKLLEGSVSPRARYLFRNYFLQYVKWCQKHGLLQDEDLDSNREVYSNLPLYNAVIHRFIIDTVVLQNGNDSGTNEIDTEAFGMIVQALQFYGKICSLYGNERMDLNASLPYFVNVNLLHTNRINWKPLVTVSLNMWNPEANSTNFKSSMERLRFLVDFQFASYTKLTFQERSRLKMSSLQIRGQTLRDTEIWYDTYDDTVDDGNGTSLHRPVSLLPQDCPFLCPWTTLAAYLFFRFYGIKSGFRGDGFPDLNNDDLVRSLPLIKGKFAAEYPRENTLGLYYSSVLKYCSLPYRKKNYFEGMRPNFPQLDYREFELLNERMPDDVVPFDFKRILNAKSPYLSDKSTASNFNCNWKNESIGPPRTILTQVFPEIEKFKKDKTLLSEESQAFLDLLELLRLQLVSNLPLIYKVFPSHELFRHDIFNNSDFQMYLHDFQLNEGDLLPFTLLAKKPAHLPDLYSYLVEPAGSTAMVADRADRRNPPVAQALTSNDQLEEIKRQNFEFIQFQTLSNFKSFIILISKIFDKLSIKNSSRREITRQINYYTDLLQEKLNSSNPKDIKDYFLKNEILKHSAGLVPSEEPSRNRKQSSNFKLLDVSEDEDEDRMVMDSGSEAGSEVDSEELKRMVEELVSDRVTSIVAEQISYLEQRLEAEMDRKLDAKLDALFNQKLKRRLSNDNDLDSDSSIETNFSLGSESLKRSNANDFAKRVKLQAANMSSSLVGNRREAPSSAKHSFRMDGNINSIEEVIIEWFTPNPDMNNQCVHSMNKTGDKTWRIPFESIYRQRKVIIELYVFLINVQHIDRYRAIELCNHWAAGKTLAEFAHFLKKWKREHGNSFESLYALNRSP